jgi:hypothetical protein
MNCRGPLDVSGTSLHCNACTTVFASDCGVSILYPSQSYEGVSEDEYLKRLCGDDQQRRKTVRKVVRKLRRNERLPGPLRRLFWRIDNTVKSIGTDTT